MRVINHGEMNVGQCHISDCVGGFAVHVMTREKIVGASCDCRCIVILNIINTYSLTISILFNVYNPYIKLNPVHSIYLLFLFASM